MLSINICIGQDNDFPIAEVCQCQSLTSSFRFFLPLSGISIRFPPVLFFVLLFFFVILPLLLRIFSSSSSLFIFAIVLFFLSRFSISLMSSSSTVSSIFSSFCSFSVSSLLLQRFLHLPLILHQIRLKSCTIAWIKDLISSFSKIL